MMLGNATHHMLYRPLLLVLRNLLFVLNVGVFNITSVAADNRSGSIFAPGFACWDVNSNGAEDSEEDTNDDGAIDVVDCLGPEGLIGSVGAMGTTGEIGITGPTGPMGAQGAIGLAGIVGPSALIGCNTVSLTTESQIAELNCPIDTRLLTGGGHCSDQLIDIEVSWQVGLIQSSQPVSNGWRLRCRLGRATAIAICCDGAN